LNLELDVGLAKASFYGNTNSRDVSKN